MGRRVKDHRVDLANRSVFITTHDLSNMGLSVASELQVPEAFLTLDRSIDRESYPRLKNWQLDSGDRVLLVAGSEETDPHFERAHFSLELPGDYTYGNERREVSHNSFGGTVSLGLAVETDMHTRDDFGSMMPQMFQGYGRHGKGIAVCDIADVAENVGFPNTILSLDVYRNFARSPEEGHYRDESIELKWAFRESNLAGISLETRFQDSHDPNRKVRKGLFEDIGLGMEGVVPKKVWDEIKSKWNHRSWGCGIYPTNEGGIGRGRDIDHLDKETYAKVIGMFMGHKPADKLSPLVLGEYGFHGDEDTSEKPNPAYTEGNLIPMVASVFGPAVIKTVSEKK